MKRPRILLTNFHPEMGGGHDTFILSLAGGSLKKDFQFALAVPKTSYLYAAAKAAGIEVFPCDYPSKLKELAHTIRSVWEFAHICKTFKPDIVHTNGGADNDIVAWSLAFQRKVFSILRTHHAVREMPRDLYHQWLYRFIVSRNVYVSESARAMSQTAKSWHLPNTIVIENGVNTDWFAPQPTDRALKNALGIQADEFVFGSCAGTAGYKRLDIMFSAAAALQHAYPFKVVILGQEGSRDLLMSMAASAGVSGRVIYGGFQKDIRRYCSVFDVGFILSDSVETISYASREMLSMGIPLISSSYSGLRENIEDGQNGFLVRPGNVEDVVDKMKIFMTMTPEETARFRQNARNKAVSSFGIQKQMDGFYAAYQSLLK